MRLVHSLAALSKGAAAEAVAGGEIGLSRGSERTPDVVARVPPVRTDSSCDHGFNAANEVSRRPSRRGPVASRIHQRRRRAAPLPPCRRRTRAHGRARGGGGAAPLGPRCGIRATSCRPARRSSSPSPRWCGSACSSFNLYAPQHVSAPGGRRVIGASGVGIVLLAMGSFWLKSSFSRGVGLTWGLVLMLELLSRRLWRTYQRRLRIDGQLALRTLVVGTSAEASRLVEVLQVVGLGVRSPRARAGLRPDRLRRPAAHRGPDRRPRSPRPGSCRRLPLRRAGGDHRSRHGPGHAGGPPGGGRGAGPGQPAADAHLANWPS